MKLHIVVNEFGDLVNVSITISSSDYRKHVPILTKRLIGLVFGDKGYISSELFERLFKRGIKLATGIKKNMKNKLMSLRESLYFANVP